MLDKLLPLEAEQREYNKQLDILNKMAPALTAEQYQTALENLTSTLSVNAEKTRELKAARESLADWDVKVAQVNMSAAEKEIDNLQRANSLVEKRINLLLAEGEIAPELAEKYHQAFGVQLQRDIEAVNEKTTEMSKMFEDVAKNIQSGFASMFENVFSGATDTMSKLVADIKSMFVKMLAQMATMAIAKPIIIPMIAAVGSAMGVSNAGIAQAAGTDTASIANIVSSGYSLSSAVGTGLNGMKMNAGIMAQRAGFDGTASTIHNMTSEAFAGWSAGIVTFVMGLLSGEEFVKAAAKGVGAGIGAWGGAKAGAAIGSYFPGAGTVIGGAIGAIIGAFGGSSIMGSLFKEKEDDFGIPRSVAAQQGRYTADKGFVPNAITYDPNYNETAQWYHPILSAYSATVATIQDSFNKTLADFTAQLPVEMRTQMMANLASADMVSLLAKASEGEWLAKDAEAALKQVATAYAKGLDALVSQAYATALGDFVTSKGAAGLLDDTDAWAMLTSQVQGRIQEAFNAAAAQIKGGDIEGGTAAISSVSEIIAQIGQAMAPISEIIATNGMSDYELQLRSINKQFDDYRDQLAAAGVDMVKYTDLETARGMAISKVAEQARAEAEQARADAMAPINEIIATNGLDAAQLSYRNLAIQFDAYRVKLDEVGASFEDYIKLGAAMKIATDEVVNAELKRRAQVDLQAVISTVQASADAMIKQYGDLTAAMDELNPVAANLVDSWRSNKTELEVLISGLAEAMGELPEPTALDRLRTTLSALASATNGIASLNEQIFALQTGTAGAAAIDLLRAREQQLFAEMATSLDPGGVASQLAGVITKRVTMQAKLEEEATNARYQAEYDAANEVARLEKQLRADRIDALREQIDAAKTLVDVVSSMPQYLAGLRSGDLSALNPADQLAVAQGSFQSFMASAKAGDQDAMRNLQGAGSGYLQEAQGYWGGATSQYAAIFAEVTGALEQFGAQPVTDIDLLQDQIDYLQGIEDATTELQTVTIDTTNQQVAALTEIRTALQRREDQLERQKAEDRKAAQDQIDQLKAVVANQAAQIRQQGAIHADLMAQLRAANASLDSLESTATLEASAP